jgi:uncharacterized membrane protein YdjX (TVP38/TMEM64 family)
LPFSSNFFSWQNSQRQILVVGALVIGAGLVAASDVLHGRIAELVSLSESVISRSPLAGMIIFVLLAAASAMLAFFSSAILVPVGIYAWGAVVCFFLLWLGWLIGGVLSFAVGRYLGYTVAAAIIGERRMAEFRRRVGRRHRFVHILLFQAAVPSEIPGYLLGSLRFSFWVYLGALALAELPYAFATVYVGASFLERDSLELVAIGAGSLLLVAAGYGLIRHWRRRKFPARTKREGETAQSLTDAG